MGESSPVEMLWGLINAHTLARCVHVVADFGVADALGESPASVSELAVSTGMNADALGRMLRLLAAQGVFALGPQGYVHTPASRLLRSDHPQSLQSLARMMGMPVTWRGFTELRHAAKTGRPATDWANLVAYFADHADEARLFNQAMVDKSAGVVPAIVDAYDFSAFTTIADIGGGRGHLLRAILERVPTASGILFDLPHVIADAADAASQRLQLAAGDVFRDPLPVADAYVLMEVIHDWPDDDASKIFAAIRRVMPRHARLLVIEALVSEAPGPDRSKMLDIVMLAITGGRERTRGAYEALLKPAGFRLERIIPTPSGYSVVEAVLV